MSQGDQKHWYWTAGDVIGGIGGFIAFIWIYIAAVGSEGWVIGLALGWIPAGIGACVCYPLLRLLWLPALGLLALAFLSA